MRISSEDDLFETIKYTLNKKQEREMNDKYFIPEIEDLYIGYECTIETNLGLKFGVFPELLNLNKQLDEFGNDNFMKAAHAILKTPYLTKEQIEKEGWKLEDFDDDGVVWFEKNNYELIYFDTYKTTNRIVVKYFGGVVFEGKIKCVNELKTLMKFLEI